MSEALLLSVIQEMDDYRENNPPTGKEHSYQIRANQEMERVIKEMREIVDIVRDKKLEEGRILNFFVSDLIYMANYILYLSKYDYYMYNKSILSWIGEIKKQMLKLGDDESNMRSSENVEDDVDVVGFEEEVEMLIHTRIIGKALQSKKSMFKTVVIKGMGGSGKTTLAREIYNHPTVRKHFEHRAWVSNSTHFTLKELFIKLIQQVKDRYKYTTLVNMDARRLQGMACKHLQGKRYLIVLDDVPKQMHLRSFLNALPKEIHGSRCLFTSHMRHMDIDVRDEDVHQMKPLDSTKSWLLFLKTINHGNKLTGELKFPMNLEHLGKQMLRKCGGLPLAIKEVGKQLAEKKVSGGGEWEQLLESVDFGSTLKLLEPFYHKLDPQLESCFLHVSLFKENTTLRAERLREIWHATGVVSRSNYEPYINGLIDESFVEVGDKGTEYHMNPLLHMLAIQKAEEKLGFEILRNNGYNRPSESPRHHRVIICSRDKFNYSTDQDKHLVSLFFHGGGYMDTSSSYWKSFELLKILDLEDFGLKFLPESIDKLMELRYLGSRNNYIQELPQSLGCLKKLEVLDVAQNFMVEVPDIIWEMCSLRHIYMSDVICRRPLKIDALQFLETLTYVSIDNWKYELSGFKMLTLLKKLGIEELDGNSDARKLFVSLAELKDLSHLILRGYRFRSMPCLDKLRILQNLRTLKLDGLLSRLPTSFPPRIESLTLVNSCLDEDPMPLLAAMSLNLKYLKLRNAYTGQQMVILNKSFPHLKVMCIEELWNLRNVQCGERAIFRLEKLEIHDCPYLDTLPNSLFLCLKKLMMVTTKSIATKIRNSEYLISKIAIVNINA